MPTDTIPLSSKPSVCLRITVLRATAAPLSRQYTVRLKCVRQLAPLITSSKRKVTRRLTTRLQLRTTGILRPIKTTLYRIPTTSPSPCASVQEPSLCFASPLEVPLPFPHLVSYQKVWRRSDAFPGLDRSSKD
jgi:hypothetical protein